VSLSKTLYPNCSWRASFRLAWLTLPSVGVLTDVNRFGLKRLLNALIVIVKWWSLTALVILWFPLRVQPWPVMSFKHTWLHVVYNCSSVTTISLQWTILYWRLYTAMHVWEKCVTYLKYKKYNYYTLRINKELSVSYLHATWKGGKTVTKESHHFNKALLDVLILINNPISSTFPVLFSYTFQDTCPAELRVLGFGWSPTLCLL
jgi:hypothetical protein